VKKVVTVILTVLMLVGTAQAATAAPRKHFPLYSKER
jgi:hypothetical protein